MRAAILVRNQFPLELAELQMPPNLTFGQVHVQIHFSGICGAQINEIEGTKGPDKFLPHLLGHEGSGTVQRVGPGVTRVKSGDRVVLHWKPSAGIQSETPRYDCKGQTVNAGWVTTFNDEAIISENRLTVIPNDFNLRIAPLFGCAVTTAVGVVNNDAQVKIGQSVVIYGVGGVGLNIAQAAQMVSADPIIGIDRFDNKLIMGHNWGLTHSFNSTKLGSALPDQIRAIVGDSGADVVVDTTGNSRVIEQAYDLTHPDGRTILVGVPRKGDLVSIYTLPLHFKKILTGSHGGGVSPDIEIPRLVNLVRKGKMRLDGQVTHTFPLDRVNDALKALRSGEAARVLLDMGNS